MNLIFACMMTVAGQMQPCAAQPPTISEYITPGGSKVINIGPGEGAVSYDRQGGCRYIVSGGYRRLYDCDNRIVIMRAD